MFLTIELKRLRGSVEAHYARLRSYVAELKRVDREGCFKLEISWDSERNVVVFKGIYICFSGLRKGFLEGCRPIINLDGAFLKTMIGGALLSAIGHDGNN